MGPGAQAIDILTALSPLDKQVISGTCATSHPDLYWAIRGGGGNNFGVAVDFEVRPISAPTMVYFNTTWPYDKVQDLLTTWQEWTCTGSDDLGSVMSVFLPDGAQGTVPVVQIVGGYLGPTSNSTATSTS